MKVGPPPAGLCNTCRRPLGEAHAPAPCAGKYLAPDLKTVHKYFAASKQRALDAALPIPRDNGAEFLKLRDDVVTAMQLLARNGAMNQGELIERFQKCVKLTDEPVKLRLKCAHNYGVLSMDPPPKDGRQFIEAPERPHDLRHNEVWISLTPKGELALLRLTIFDAEIQKEAEKRGLTLEDVNDPDIDIATITANARKMFRDAVLVTDEELGRQLEVEPIDQG